MSWRWTRGEKGTVAQPQDHPPILADRTGPNANGDGPRLDPANPNASRTRRPRWPPCGTHCEMARPATPADAIRDGHAVRTSPSSSKGPTASTCFRDRAGGRGRVAQPGGRPRDLIRHRSSTRAKGLNGERGRRPTTGMARFNEPEAPPRRRILPDHARHRPRRPASATPRPRRSRTPTRWRAGARRGRARRPGGRGTPRTLIAHVVREPVEDDFDGNVAGSPTRRNSPGSARRSTRGRHRGPQPVPTAGGVPEQRADHRHQGLPHGDHGIRSGSTRPAGSSSWNQWTRAPTPCTTADSTA